MFLIYIPCDYLLPYLLSLLLSKFFCSPVLHLIKYISFVDASRDVLWLCEPCKVVTVSHLLQSPISYNVGFSLNSKKNIIEA